MQIYHDVKSHRTVVREAERTVCLHLPSNF